MARGTVLRIGAIASTLACTLNGCASVQTVAPPAAISVEGAPPVPRALVEAVAPYLQWRAARRESWHPSSRQALIKARAGPSEQLFLVPHPGAQPVQMTQGPERAQLSLFQPTSGQYILFFRDVGGSERYQMYRRDLVEGTTTLLTDGSSRNTPGTWSPDGRLFAYRSNRRTGRQMDIHVMDPLRPESSRLAVELPAGFWRIPDWSPDGRQLLLIEMRSDVDTRLWLADTETGVRTLIANPSNSSVLYEYALFAPDGTGIFALSDHGTGLQHLTRIDLATARHQDLTPALPWNIEQFDIGADGSRIVYSANEAGISRVYLYDVRTAAVAPCAGIPPGIVRDLEWLPDGQEFAFTLEMSGAPNDVYSFDPRRALLTRWTNSEAPQLADIPPPELVRWRAADGVESSGILQRPPARFRGPRPIMIRIHGGPLAQSRPDYLGALNYYLSEMGVAVLFPNVRGSTGYGRAFQGLDDGVGRERTMDDIGALLEWIGRDRGLNSSRIMVTGASYGGLLSLMAAATFSDRIACAASAVGIADLLSFVEQAPEDERESRRAEYGDERDPATRAFLRRFSPVNRAGEIRKPLLVVAAANDARIPVSHPRAVRDAVRNQGTPVWYLEASNEGHGYERGDNRDFAFYVAAMFSKRCLLE